MQYCIRGYFHSGFIFMNFANQSVDENITKITKLSHHEFLHLVQNRENIYAKYYMYIGVYSRYSTLHMKSGHESKSEENIKIINFCVQNEWRVTIL